MERELERGGAARMGKWNKAERRLKNKGGEEVGGRGNSAWKEEEFVYLDKDDRQISVDDAVKRVRQAGRQGNR